MHVNSKRHGTVQTIILLTDIIDIPTIYLQLRTVRKVATNNDTNNINGKNLPTSATRQSNHYTNPHNELHSCMTAHPSTTNDATSTSKTSIRRSQRILNLRQQLETLKT